MSDTPLTIDVLTIFPEMVRGPMAQSIMGRAQEEKRVTLRVHDLRDWATGRHRQVDDEPYGGGQGMVMKPEPFFAAVETLRQPDTRVILMTPQGRPLVQQTAQRLATHSGHLIILCGHYEGIDHRVIEHLVHEEISIGDYVLTNGAIAAVILLDAVIRLLPGVLGDERSAVEESFAEPLLIEAPCYTRPVDYCGHKVPDILLSGHHAKIQQWKKAQSRHRTATNRPDLFAQLPPEPEPKPKRRRKPTAQEEC
jgi:tRNA (guanine37-N1)-methyltransferase